MLASRNMVILPLAQGNASVEFSWETYEDSDGNRAVLQNMRRLSEAEDGAPMSEMYREQGSAVRRSKAGTPPDTGINIL